MGTIAQDVLGGSASAGSTSADVLTGLAGGVAYKAPCAVATTGNVALTGLAAVDGVTPTGGARVLVWQQTDTTQNGIWNASAGAWTRAVDCDGLGKLLQGTQVVVVNGASLGGLVFQVTTPDPVAIGTGPVAFGQSAFAPTAYVKRDGSTDITGNQAFRAGTRFATAAGAVRFAWDRVNAETGISNTGADLQLSAYADDGVTNLGPVATVKRATRVLDFAVAPTIGGASFTSIFGAAGAGHSAGIVPDPGATAGVQRVLREDSTWAIPLARGGASGLKITNNSGTPNSQISITARNTVIGNPTTGFAYATGVSVTINLATNQVANGIAEVTVKQPSTWYYLYLIAKTDGSGTVAGLATSVAPGTAPALPTGYTAYEYVGAMRTDSSGNLLRTIQLGAQGQYQPASGVTNNTSYPLMASGTATTWTAIAVASFVPAAAGQIRVKGAGIAGSTTAQFTAVSPNNADTTVNHAPIYIGGSGSGTIVFGGSTADFVLEGANIYWGSTLTGEVRCLGWRDSVNAT